MDHGERTKSKSTAAWMLAPTLVAFALAGCGTTDGNPTAAVATVAPSTEQAPVTEQSVPIGGTQEVVDGRVTTRVTVDSLVPARASQYGLSTSGQLQQVTVILEGVAGTTNVNPLYFSARAADGTSYDPELGALDGQLTTGTVTAGDLLKGVVAFDVTGPPIASIRYNDALGDELAKWTGRSDGVLAPSAPTTTVPSAPPAVQATGDLGIASTPISVPACDGTGIVVLYSAVDPNSYEQEVAAQLQANPGAQYLRTDNSCPSLRQATAGGTRSTPYTKRSDRPSLRCAPQ